MPTFMPPSRLAHASFMPPPGHTPPLRSSLCVRCADAQVGEKLQALWEAHVRLDLPLLPSGSEALVALLLGGAAIVGALLVLRRCRADNARPDALAPDTASEAGDAGDARTSVLHIQLILERARALMRLRGALGEAAYESRTPPGGASATRSRLRGAREQPTAIGCVDAEDGSLLLAAPKCMAPRHEPHRALGVDEQPCAEQSEGVERTW